MSYSTFIGDAMMQTLIYTQVQTLIYTQDRLTKLITLSVVELGYSVKNSVDEAFNTFKCLALDPNEILKIETKEMI